MAKAKTNKHGEKKQKPETEDEWLKRQHAKGIGLPSDKQQRIEAKYDEPSAFALRKASLGFKSELPKRLREMGWTLSDLLTPLKTILKTFKGDSAQVAELQPLIAVLEETIAMLPQISTLTGDERIEAEARLAQFFGKLVHQCFRNHNEEDLFLMATRRKYDLNDAYSDRQICHWIWLTTSGETPTEDKVIDQLNQVEFMTEAAARAHINWSAEDVENSKLFREILSDGLMIMQRNTRIDRFGLQRLSGPIELAHLRRGTETAIATITAQLSVTKDTWSQILGLGGGFLNFIKGVSQLTPLPSTPPVFELWVKKKLLEEIILKEQQTADNEPKKEKWEEEAERLANRAKTKASTAVEINRKFDDLIKEYPSHAESINRDRRRALDDLRDWK